MNLFVVCEYVRGLLGFVDIKNVVTKLTIVDDHHEHAAQCKHSLNVFAVRMAVEPVVQRNLQPFGFFGVYRL